MKGRPLALAILTVLAGLTLYFLGVYGVSRLSLPLGDGASGGGTKLQQAITVFVFVSIACFVVLLLAVMYDTWLQQERVSAYFPAFIANKIVIMLSTAFGAVVAVNLLRDGMVMSWAWLYDRESRLAFTLTLLALPIVFGWQAYPILRHQYHVSARAIATAYASIVLVSAGVVLLAVTV